MRKRLATKKILIASLGVGAVSYATGCGGSATSPTSQPQDAAADTSPGPTGGNLMATPVPDAAVDSQGPDAGADSQGPGAAADSQGPDAAADSQGPNGARDAQADIFISTSGNLMAVPIDSGGNGD
jgi:hypothetical protein